MIGRQRRDGHQRDAGRRLEAVPDALRNDHHHARPKLLLLRPRVGDRAQHRRALEDVHDLVAGRMPLPSTGAAELAGEDAAVAIRREPRQSLAAVGFRTGGRARELCQLGQLGIEIENGGHLFLPPKMAQSTLMLAFLMTGPQRLRSAARKAPKSAAEPVETSVPICYSLSFTSGDCSA